MSIARDNPELIEVCFKCGEPLNPHWRRSLRVGLCFECLRRADEWLYGAIRRAHTGQTEETGMDTNAKEKP